MLCIEIAAATPAVSGPIVCPMEAYDWLMPSILPCSDCSTLSAIMALSMGLRKPLNKPYIQRHIPKGIIKEVKPTKNMPAKHNIVENSNMTCLEGNVFIKNGTLSCMMMPQMPNPAKRNPIVKGVIFKTSTLKV